MDKKSCGPKITLIFPSCLHFTCPLLRSFVPSAAFCSAGWLAWLVALSPAGCGMIIADWLHASDGTKWTRKANKFAFLRPRLPAGHCVHVRDRSNFLRASGHLRLINSPLDALAGQLGFEYRETHAAATALNLH